MFVQERWIGQCYFDLFVRPVVAAWNMAGMGSDEDLESWE